MLEVKSVGAVAVTSPVVSNIGGIVSLLSVVRGTVFGVVVGASGSLVVLSGAVVDRGLVFIKVSRSIGGVMLKYWISPS